MLDEKKRVKTSQGFPLENDAFYIEQSQSLSSKYATNFQINGRKISLQPKNCTRRLSLQRNAHSQPNIPRETEQNSLDILLNKTVQRSNPRFIPNAKKRLTKSSEAHRKSMFSKNKTASLMKECRLMVSMENSSKSLTLLKNECYVQTPKIKKGSKITLKQKILKLLSSNTIKDSTSYENKGYFNGQNSRQSNNILRQDLLVLSSQMKVNFSTKKNNHRALHSKKCRFDRTLECFH